MTKIFQNYILTGLLMLGISILTGVIVELIASLLRIGTSGGLVGGVVSPMLIGQMYAQKFQTQMSQEFKLRAVGVYLAAQIGLGLPLVIVLFKVGLIEALVGFLIAGAIVFGLSYYLIGAGERSVLRRLGK